jgi:hypothetical protein
MKTYTDTAGHPMSSELTVIASDDGERAWFGLKGNTSHKSLPATLIPIDYADVEFNTVHGIPMWYELPFQLIQDSVLQGFGRKDG